MNNSLQQSFKEIISSQSKCANAFDFFIESLEKHKEQKRHIRNSLKAKDLIGKKYLFNRPGKWGGFNTVKSNILEENNYNFFSQENNEILKYYSQVDVFDIKGIEKFLGQFQDLHKIQDKNPQDYYDFFNKDYNYIVLWVLDLEYEGAEELEIFNHPSAVYEYVIFQVS